MDYIPKYYLDELQLQRANVLTIITKEISVGVILDFLFIVYLCLFPPIANFATYYPNLMRSVV
jgi:hypothetical protein